MKEFTTSIHLWMDAMDRRWKCLPARDYRRIVLYGFAVYTVITLAVMVQIVYQVSISGATMHIEHISNPVAKITATKKITEPKTTDDERE